VLEEFGCDDHHSALAESAQRSLLFDPCLLNGVKRVFRFAGREALCFAHRAGKPSSVVTS